MPFRIALVVAACVRDATEDRTDDAARSRRHAAEARVSVGDGGDVLVGAHVQGLDLAVEVANGGEAHHQL